MTVFGTVVAPLAGGIVDGSIAKVDVRVMRLASEPLLRERLQLLTDTAGRRHMARLAGERIMASVHRSRRTQVRLSRCLQPHRDREPDENAGAEPETTT